MCVKCKALTSAIVRAALVQPRPLRVILRPRQIIRRIEEAHGDRPQASFQSAFDNMASAAAEKNIRGSLLLACRGPHESTMIGIWTFADCFRFHEGKGVARSQGKDRATPDMFSNMQSVVNRTEEQFSAQLASQGSSLSCLDINVGHGICEQSLLEMSRIVSSNWVALD